MADDELASPTDDAQDDQSDKDWQAETTKWKALARKHEMAAKDNADAAQRLAEIEGSGKTEQERLAEARRAADERATTADIQEEDRFLTHWRNDLIASGAASAASIRRWLVSMR